MGLRSLTTAATWHKAVHPHVRGAQMMRVSSSYCPCGPSPRAWGSAARTTTTRPSFRSIPTCVGLRLGGEGASRQAPVHPHVRGAQVVLLRETKNATGPSPRAWGSACCPADVCRRARSIPTCVGLSRPEGHEGVQAPVHPHVRGAQSPTTVRPRHSTGPSPRAWGSAGERSQGAGEVRSIPTCVGLRIFKGLLVKPTEVHPHVRGAQSNWEELATARGGPSPRAWGSGLDGVDVTHRHRSIPTCVGLRTRAEPCPVTVSVHPHVRGAQPNPGTFQMLLVGPSPRAWGSGKMTCTNASRYLPAIFTRKQPPPLTHPYHTHLEPTRESASHRLITPPELRRPATRRGRGGRPSVLRRRDSEDRGGTGKDAGHQSDP
ncbi:hypothetical protein B005_4363 [Nocardiopsis alba ATCC BAA-2165]|uniref:Uncharacterized protein n=1 Tax=Nocardiopsis alba (strain ATCC BAA-2165 / BE74) TaxID=1205910 RepID=J7L6P6_NOCAA|nr:hypothetical protein B005_4363 [Nocardiopsis alba ATCC BAA-2165]